jgi:hypothetical protein
MLINTSYGLDLATTTHCRSQKFSLNPATLVAPVTQGSSLASLLISDSTTALSQLSSIRHLASFADACAFAPEPRDPTAHQACSRWSTSRWSVLRELCHNRYATLRQASFVLFGLAIFDMIPSLLSYRRRSYRPNHPFQASHPNHLLALSKTNAHIAQHRWMSNIGSVRVAVNIRCPLELGGICVACADVACLQGFELLLGTEFVSLMRMLARGCAQKYRVLGITRPGRGRRRTMMWNVSDVRREG